MAATIYVSPPLNVSNLDRQFTRADIIFHGIDHAGPSYEGAVFLNNPSANQETLKTTDNGYAGSFHIFGHGGCLGDAGHCDVKDERRLYDPRPAHPLTPGKKVVIATDALLRVLQAGAAGMTVTVVPVVTSPSERTDNVNVFKIERLSIATYC